MDAVKAALTKSLKQPTEVNRGDFALRKDATGQYNLLGKFSNRWRDVDFHANPLNGGEIVTSDAHKEFAKWLDKHPQHALELWSFHHWGTARKSRANWWDWSGNNFYMNWPLTDEEAKSISAWMLDNEPGMSFGFYSYGNDREKGLITKYRAFEASILPKKYAANPWASFQLHSQENDMAFSPEKRKALVTLHGEAFVKELENSDEKQAAVLDAAGVETKEVKQEEVATEVVAEVEVVDAAKFATNEGVVAALEKIQAVFHETVTDLMKKVAALTDEVNTLKAEKALEAKAAAAPLSVLAAWTPKSILDQKQETVAEPVLANQKNSAQIPSNSSLARSAPKLDAKARKGAALTLADIQNREAA